MHNLRTRTKLGALAIVMLLLFTIGLSTIPPAKANPQFIMASWEYDDGYGQGIEVVYISENSTGTWEGIYQDPAYTLWNDPRPLELNYTEDTALRIWPYVNLNHTLHNLTAYVSAFAIMRVSIEVYVAGNLTFSQQNLTWGEAVFDDTPTTWAFGCWVIIPLILTGGTIYTIDLTYEIYAVI